MMSSTRGSDIPDDSLMVGDSEKKLAPRRSPQQRMDNKEKITRELMTATLPPQRVHDGETPVDIQEAEKSVEKSLNVAEAFYNAIPGQAEINDDEAKQLWMGARSEISRVQQLINDELLCDEDRKAHMHRARNLWITMEEKLKYFLSIGINSIDLAQINPELKN
jgi:hypothetical protein